MKIRECALKTSLIACENSVMSMFDAQRELGIDLHSTTTQAMIDLIASEADLARVKRLAFLTSVSGKITLNAKTLDGQQFNREFARLYREQSDLLAADNGWIAATAIVAGVQAARWFLAHPGFLAFPDGKPGAVISIVGEIFGASLYVVPESFTTSFAASGDLFPLASEVFHSGGQWRERRRSARGGRWDTTTAGLTNTIQHPITKSLKQRSTLLVQSLCDINVDGDKYARRVTLNVVTA